jgi:hypothetical protein
MLQPQFAPVKYDLIRLSGGLDQVTPTLSLKPGVARDCVNFEASITGGYSRIAGYERFDGRPNPSDANYNVITVALTAPLSVGNTITGVSSGATGVVILVNATTVVFTKFTGSFLAAESVTVGGTPVGTVAALGGALSADARTLAEYLALAADNYRADIGPVPGSGPIRGVAYYNRTVYAWRNNVGNTALNMYKSSSSGWTQVSLGYELSFDTGSTALADGDVVNGHSSGATGTIARVVLESGAWSTGDAAGRLIFASITGTFRASDHIRVGSTKYAEAASTQSAITLLPDGRMETVIANFGGGVSSTRLFGADGLNRAFEFDGTTYVPLRTGMAVDAPEHIAFHKQHLFLSFGSSVQFSSIGDPYRWDPVLGAGEIALIDNVTCFMVQPGDQSTGAMAVYSDSNTFILYGSSSENFNLVSYNIGTGAKAYSVQNLGITYVFDDRGVINLQTTLNYGNFDSAALTMNIRPFIQQRRNLLTCSGVNREKGQYRIFFSDGYGLYLTFSNGQMIGAMPVQFPDPTTCMCEGQKPDGSETSFFGSTSGYVYRLDAGTSFDGEEISANMVLVFDSINSPRVLKRYRRASLEITGTSYAEFAFNYELGYGSTEYEQPDARSYDSNLVASFWDRVAWDAFIWDGRTLAPSEVEVEGTAENIAVRVASISSIYDSFTINSVILHYSQRRGLR